MPNTRMTLSLALACGFVPSLFPHSAATGTTSSPCGRLIKPIIPGANVTSIQSQHLSNASVLAAPPLLNSNITGLDICNVDIVLSHLDANDSVKIKVWLPTTGWNGRFIGTGGSGYAAGLFEYNLAPVVALGYAAASTDAGLSGDPYSPALWALDAHGNLNEDLLLNFASRSVHDMAVAGKAVATQFYGKTPRKSYWNGCSTGGRQGLTAAQTYPDDFDGIVAGAPAIDWARYVVAEQWPQVVMREAGTYVSPCVLEAFTNASTAACDSLDYAADGVVSNPGLCAFNSSSLIGTVVQCGGHSETITKADAAVLNQIVAGPTGPLYPHRYALNLGASLIALANNTISVNGTRSGLPFFVNDAWIKYFVKKDPKFDTTTIGFSAFQEIFNQSQQEYGNIIGSYNPDLSAFQAAGGKAIVWHGLADQLIFPADTIAYHQNVQKAIGNVSTTAGFYRTFLAPGVDHCGAGPGPGPVPTDPLAAIVAWVEQGKAPDVLKAQKVKADGTVLARDICAFPLRSRYRSGDVNLASSYVCA